MISLLVSHVVLYTPGRDQGLDFEMEYVDFANKPEWVVALGGKVCAAGCGVCTGYVWMQRWRRHWRRRRNRIGWRNDGEHR